MLPYCLVDGVGGVGGTRKSGDEVGGHDGHRVEGLPADAGQKARDMTVGLAE